MITLKDFERHARDHLPHSVYHHISAGANDQQSRDDNCTAFRRYRIRPRVLRDVSTRDLSATILGREFPVPIGISPTSLQGLACSDGELAMARAASFHGVIMILSTYSTSSLEDVASAAAPSGHLWLQLYVLTDRRHTESLVHRAKAAGYKAIVVTADTPYAGWKYIDERYDFNPNVRLPNLEGGHFSAAQGSGTQNDYRSTEISPSVTWADIRWVQSLTDLPIIVKGIISAENALEAVANNVDGMIVSNHGGRQLDGVPAPIDVLPEVMAATRGTKVEVYLDGGIRQGTDVLKALALGVKAVFVGRPAWWGLTYKGEEGVKQVLQILQDELDLAVALSGYASIRDLTPSMLVRGPDVAAVCRL